VNQFMQKHEAKGSVLFRHWIMANPMKIQCWFEMKDSRGNKSFNLKEWKEAQRNFAEALRHSKKGVLVRTEGTPGLPDYKYAYQEPTFIVIFYPEGFLIIESETLAMYKGKSITFEQGEKIAHHAIRKNTR